MTIVDRSITPPLVTKMTERTDRLLSVGVIGTGSMGRHHARVYHELPRVKLVGVTDENAERAASIADTYETTPVKTDELLEIADAVSIAVPTKFHYELVKKALDSGVHVLVEKPFVLDIDRGRELVTLADEADVTLQVGHIERFNPAIQALPRILDDRRVIALDAQRLGPPIENDRDVTDDVIIDLMIHDIDVFLSIVDDPSIDGIHAAEAAENRYVTAVLAFSNGVVGSLTSSRITQKKVRTLTITTDECQVAVDYIDRSIRIYRSSIPEYVETDGQVRYRNESVIEIPTIGNGEPLKNELNAFLDSIVTGSEPPVSGRDGLRALEVAHEISTAANARHRSSNRT